MLSTAEYPNHFKVAGQDACSYAGDTQFEQISKNTSGFESTALMASFELHNSIDGAEISTVVAVKCWCTRCGPPT